MEKLNSENVVSFDFIVIGAGSSCMGFLAGLLQADHRITVAVVERGEGGHDENGNNKNKNNNQTAHWYRESHHHHDDDSSSSSSSHCSTILTASCWGRIFRVPTGSGLGGTSRIHASLCLSPPADDLNNDAWPEPCRSQLPHSLDCIQQLLQQNQALHVFHHPDQRKVVAPINNKKDDDDDHVDETASMNTRDRRIRSIPCRCTVTAPDGKYRVNYYEGLVASLLPKAHHTQIKWFTSCEAQQLVMDHDSSQCQKENESNKLVITVRGVKLWNTATQSHHVLYAKRKVILAAGVFASPALLLASGLLSNDCTTNSGSSSSSSSSKSSTNHNTREKNRDDTGPIIKQQQDQSFQNDIDNDNEKQECWVDLPLMDHVMIPCAMFSWRPLVSQKQLSWNGVQSLHQVDYYYNDKTNNNNNNNKQGNINNMKRFLVSRMDATVHADILPSVLVDFLFRRRAWLLLPHLYNDIPGDWPQRRRLRPASVLRVVQKMIAVAVHALATLLEFVVRSAILWTPLGCILRYHVIIMTIFIMNPNTVGNKLSIRRRRLGRNKMTGVNKNPPRVQVKIDLPYLKDEQDIVALQAVWQDCKQLMAPHDAIEFFPGSWIRRCGYFGLFREYCRAFCLPFFHWCGTLPLGGSMVDSRFGVRHVESLCICDASVFPWQVSVPPALTCAALGHCLACLLLQQQDNHND